MIPVCKCENENCSFKYTRVLPDIMTPHKHYSTEVIENVVDGICTPYTPETEDYPCEKTMKRWEDWIAGNHNHVDGVLKSIGSRLSVFGEELLNTEDSLMDKLRDDGAGWLSILNRITRNFGMPLFNVRQLQSLSTDLSFVFREDGLTFSHKEKNSNGSQNSDRLAGKRRSGKISDHSASSGSEP